MVKFLNFFTIVILIFASNIFAKAKEIDIKKLSEAIGNVIGKNLGEFGFKADIKDVIKGIKNGSENKPSPMADDEFLNALAQIQKKENEKKALKNLQDAISFLKNNLNDKDIIEIEKEKLQYKILKNGKPPKVEPYHTPIVKMKGQYLNGKIFVNSKEAINLNETLPALKNSIIGMHLHEKRKVFIHPELIFNKSFPHLNSLVIFDIEILDLDSKANPLDQIATNIY